MVKPLLYPEWAVTDTILPATGNTNKQRPKESLRNIGWDKGQIPSAEEWNWQFDNISDWVKWFDENNETLKTVTLTGNTTGTATYNNETGFTLNTTTTQATHANDADRADKWKTARTFSFTGDTTGTGSADGSGDVSFAMTGVQSAKWKTARTFSFSGEVTGSTSVDGSSNVTLPVTITPRTTVAFSGSSSSVSLTLASYTGGTLSSSVYKVTMVDGTSYAVGDMCYNLFTNVPSGTMYVDYGDSADFIFVWSYSAGVLTLSTPSRGSFGRVDIYY